jgi:hypothetical protein
VEDQEHHGGGEDQEEEVGGEDQEEEGGGEDQEEEGDEEDLSEDEGLGNLVFDPDPSLEWCEPEDYQYVPAVERLRPRDRKPYRRGITQLPALKHWRYRHVVLQPYGRRYMLIFGISLSQFCHYQNYYHIHIDVVVSWCSSFQFEDPTQRPPRGYSNILGGLLRRYFPGIVNLPSGGCDVAWRWWHYSLAEDALGRGTLADCVVGKFWVRDFGLLTIHTLSLVDNNCTNAPCFTYVHGCRNTSRRPRARKMRAMMSFTSLQGRG